MTELRTRIVADGPLHDLGEALQEHLAREIQWWDSAGRSRATRRLRRLCPGLLQRISPTAWADAAERFAGEPYYPHDRDVQARMMAHRVMGRLAAIVAGFFGELQCGELAARGRPAVNRATVVDIQGDIWGSAATALDRDIGSIHIGQGEPAFVDVVVSRPTLRKTLSEAAARQYLATFAAALESAGRVFSTGEAAEALKREYRDAPMASIRQTARLLRDLRPGAWANGGRRPVFQVPSATELTAAGEAARQAGETHV